MTDNLRQYLIPIGAVALVLLAGIVDYLATSWFAGTSPTPSIIRTTPSGPTIPGYSFNISISSQLPNLPIDSDPVNPGRLSEF